MLYLMNSPILTAYGHWRFSGPLSLVEARLLLADGYRSAIGHASTAGFLSTLLGETIPEARATVTMQPGDRALILRLTTRLPEGKLLTAEEIAATPYELALLERID